MNIKALPSMGQRLFCCFCFVESAVCSTFAERIIRGCLGGALGGALVSSAPTELEVHPLNCTNRARNALIELRWCT